MDLGARMPQRACGRFWHTLYTQISESEPLFDARHTPVTLPPTVLMNDTMNKVTVMENVSASVRQTLYSSGSQPL
jgi:hypothetical protein